MDPELERLDEAVLLQRCRRREEAAVGLLVSRYEAPAFGFVLSLLGCGRNDARELTVAGVADAVRALQDGAAAGSFWRILLPGLLERCRRSVLRPVAGFPEGMTAAPEKRALLRLIRQGLLAMPFEARALLLLRDQLHLAYEDIGAAAGSDAKQVRAGVTAARAQLRDQLRNVASKERH
jgi:DNA-directed RNA polymerase specialized sigma24 family protein